MDDHILQAFNRSAEGVVLVDEDHAITYANKAAADLLGTTQQEAVGQKCCTLLGISGVCGGPNCPVWSAINEADGSRHRVYANRIDGERIRLDIQRLPFQGDESISIPPLSVRRAAIELSG